ncbi:hypothetical protein [Planomicrobium sp. YIM 101495]|uniref:hypothetical protein n=1 Tax=Planomicrobium sp. YIM 101495 TaxID=2665160 RepID=UPI0018AAE91D|nr:hypothetical protein [Planomicrobium sp. YIM 101495]
MAKKFSSSNAGTKLGENQRIRFNHIFAAEGVAIAIVILSATRRKTRNLFRLSLR